MPPNKYNLNQKNPLVLAVNDYLSIFFFFFETENAWNQENKSKILFLVK